MHNLFEQSDSLNRPFECFEFNTKNETFPVKPHWHYFIEIIYVKKGSAEIYSDGTKYQVSEKEMLIIHPQSVHSIYGQNDKELVYSVFKFDINKIAYNSGTYTPKFRNIFKSAFKKKMPVLFSKEQTLIMECEEIFKTCINECQMRKYGYTLIVTSKIRELLTLIVRNWLSLNFSIDSDVLNDDNEYNIDTITEYIDIHLCENIQVTDIAEKCRLSYSCFAKKFNQLYNMSCKSYIEIMRIFKVEEYLLFTDFDLNYISQETGFSDCSHMIKSFKKYRGCTPKQFRINSKTI